jgi:hypothetical protein
VLLDEPLLLEELPPDEDLEREPVEREEPPEREPERAPVDLGVDDELPDRAELGRDVPRLLGAVVDFGLEVDVRDGVLVRVRLGVVRLDAPGLVVLGWAISR